MSPTFGFGGFLLTAFLLAPCLDVVVVEVETGGTTVGPVIGELRVRVLAAASVTLLAVLLVVVDVVGSDEPVVAAKLTSALPLLVPEVVVIGQGIAVTVAGLVVVGSTLAGLLQGAARSYSHWPKTCLFRD